MASLLPHCEALEDLLLVATELASNAVLHTRSGDPGGQFTVEVTWSPQSARVIVGDQGAREVPVNIARPEHQDAEAESGRGLLLVEALSLAWGIAADTDAGWAWADVAWEAAGGLPVPVPAGTADAGTPDAGTADAGLRLAALSRAYPGTTAWFSPQSGAWRAARGGSHTLSAPSPAALTRMLADLHPRQEGHPLPTRNPLSDYPATHLDALGRSVLALLSFQDMLPTDLYVKLDLLREDISAAINPHGEPRRSIPHTAASGRRPPRDHSTT